MPQKRKDRPSSSPSSSIERNNSPDEKRSKAAVNEIFVALNTMEALDTKIEAILKKLEKNTKEVLYQFLEEQLKIDRPREKIKFQSSPFGEAKPSKIPPNHSEISTIL